MEPRWKGGNNACRLKPQDLEFISAFKSAIPSITYLKIHDAVNSLGPVYEFVCVSFSTGNLNCFRVK